MKMSLRSFILLTLFHQIHAQISCYECPAASNIFQYNITADHIPLQLNDCSIKTKQAFCFADITWQQKPIMKNSIALHGDKIYPPVTPIRPYSIEIDAETVTNNEGSETKQSIRYNCSTEQCNKPANLKILLESLILHDELHQFEYLLGSNQTFGQRQCLIYSNFTDAQEKPTTQSCDRCGFYMERNYTTKSVIAFCIPAIVPENRILRQVSFDLNTRTSSETFLIQCQTANCNSIDTFNQVYRMSEIDFDMGKFIENTTNSFSLNRIPSMVIIFFPIFMVKAFHRI